MNGIKLKFVEGQYKCCEHCPMLRQCVLVGSDPSLVEFGGCRLT